MRIGTDIGSRGARLVAVALAAGLALGGCGDGAAGAPAGDAGLADVPADVGIDAAVGVDAAVDGGVAAAGADVAGADTADADVAGVDAAPPDVADGAPVDATDGGPADIAGPADTDAAGDTTLGDPLSWPVDEDGPFVVGYRVLHTTYAPPAGLPSRTIEVHVWYPATAPTAGTPTYLGLFPDPKVFVDAPLAPSPYLDGHPVLVHSHGHKGFAGNSAELMRYVASHGWVAVAPEHKGNTLTDTPEPRPLALYLQRPLDVRAALDLVLGLEAPDPLAGALDADHVAMSAHSFGVHTAWTLAGATFDPDAIQATCDGGKVGDCTPEVAAALLTDLTDPRPLVYVPMAGGKADVFTEDGLDSATRPVLLMTGSLDKVGADALFDDIDGVDLTWVEVEGGCHQLFGLGNAVLGDAACKDLPDAEGFAIVNTWALAMLRAHVLGDPGVAGILSGAELVSPRVTVKHKEP